MTTDDPDPLGIGAFLVAVAPFADPPPREESELEQGTRTEDVADAPSPAHDSFASSSDGGEPYSPALSPSYALGRAISPPPPPSPARAMPTPASTSNVGGFVALGILAFLVLGFVASDADKPPSEAERRQKQLAREKTERERARKERNERIMIAVVLSAVAVIAVLFVMYLRWSRPAATDESATKTVVVPGDAGVADAAPRIPRIVEAPVHPQRRTAIVRRSIEPIARRLFKERCNGVPSQNTLDRISIEIAVENDLAYCSDLGSNRLIVIVRAKQKIVLPEIACSEPEIEWNPALCQTRDTEFIDRELIEGEVIEDEVGTE